VTLNYKINPNNPLANFDVLFNKPEQRCAQ